MMRIKGVDIILIDRVIKGENPFGEEIFEEREITVENVLVSPTLSEDVVNTLNLTGKKAVYTLGIPKGDTNNWEDKEVIIFGKKYKTFGTVIEGIEEMIPLSWHKKVMVERYD